MSDRLVIIICYVFLLYTYACLILCRYLLSLRALQRFIC